jgi:hypothetical protein
LLINSFVPQNVSIVYNKGKEEEEEEIKHKENSPKNVFFPSA